jgi:hypothetical protein
VRERGSSLVEAILVGLLLMVPALWIFTVGSELHRAALASTAAVREAGLDATRTSSPGDAGRAVQEAVAFAFVNHGLDPRRTQTTWRGSLRRGGAVEVHVRYDVRVARFPFLGRIAGPTISVRARHLAPVDLYASDR